MTHAIKGAALAFVAALCMTLAAQEPKPSICGLDKQNPTANIDLVQVSCVDYDRLRELQPSAPWPKGQVTQVLVHVREGDAVKITVGGVAQFAELVRDSEGRLIALVQFDGAGHTSVDVKVYKAVD